MLRIPSSCQMEEFARTNFVVIYGNGPITSKDTKNVFVFSQMDYCLITGEETNVFCKYSFLLSNVYDSKIANY